MQTMLVCGDMLERMARVASCIAVLSAPLPARAFTELQRGVGSTIYGARCAHCHALGDHEVRGQRPLVGSDALPKVILHPYRPFVPLETVRDLYEYVQLSMPRDAPGTLSASDALAVTAFLLGANGVPADGMPLDAQLASGLALDDLLPQRQSSKWPWLLAGVACACVLWMAAKKRRRTR